jgi:hypothetical protein
VAIIVSGTDEQLILSEILQALSTTLIRFKDCHARKKALLSDSDGLFELTTEEVRSEHLNKLRGSLQSLFLNDLMNALARNARGMGKSGLRFASVKMGKDDLVADPSRKGRIRGLIESANPRLYTVNRTSHWL